MTVYKQTKFHRPCGHWHLRLFEETPGGYARNCWMPSLAVSGSTVFFVAAGKHMQTYAATGCEIYMFLYDIGANTFTLIHENLKVNAANTPGGCATDDGIYMFANYKADAHGTRLAPEYFDNFAIGVWVSDGTTMNYTEFAGPDQSLQFKVGCFQTGTAAFAYVDGSGNIVVKASTDFGATWNTVKTILAANWTGDFSLCVTSAANIYLAYCDATGKVVIENSYINVSTWGTLEVGETILAGITKLRLCKDGSRYFIFAENGTTGVAKWSSNGTSWSSVSDYPANSIIAAGTNTVDGKSDYSINVAYDGVISNKVYDSDAAAYVWTDKTLEDVSGIFKLNADMSGYSVFFAYSAYQFYYTPLPTVIFALSVDNGVTWKTIKTPLTWAGSADEITDFDGNPRDWAERFVKQRDVFEPWNGI